MPDQPFSAVATTTAVTVTINGPQSGLQWIVWQLSVETIPFRPGAVAVVKRNGRLVTSTVNGGRSAAQGPPALRISSSDVLTIDWTAVHVGDEAVCTLYYEETQWDQYGSTFGLV